MTAGINSAPSMAISRFVGPVGPSLQAALKSSAIAKAIPKAFECMGPDVGRFTQRKLKDL